MNSLREYLLDAKKRKVAIGHFNFSNLEGLYAIARAAKSLSVPVIVGVSEGEEEAIGTSAAVALVQMLRKEWSMPIFLNADHHHSFATIKNAIDAGFDAVLFDGSKLPYEENVKQSKECVEYARNYSKQTGRDVVVEIELGYIGDGSMIRDVIPEGIASVTDADEARRFMTEAEADMLAPAVGNFHGMLRHGQKPRLDIECIKKLSKEVGTPLVLHGGSGEDRDFAAAIEAGISVVHINTELRATYTKTLRAYLEEHTDEIVPYKYGANAGLAMERLVQEKLKVFNHLV